MRIAITTLLLGTLFSIVVTLLWQEEFRYSLPTPIPEAYQEVALGACIPSFIEKGLEKGQFLHFYNPDCACSRFNLRHFKALYRDFEGSLPFVVIIPEGASLRAAQRQLPKGISIVVDEDAYWANQCGVYATPQAVIISATGALYYRGNYNKARFCTYPGTNYAEISLALLLQGRPVPDWGPLATTAYGCEYAPSEASSSLFFWSQFTYN